MTFTRSLAAASTCLAFMGAFTLVHHTAPASAEGGQSIKATLIINGKSHTVTSDATNLSDLLRQSGVSIGSADEVYPPLSSAATDGMVVRIHTLQTHTSFNRDYTPYHTIYQPSVRLLPGRRMDIQQGMRGIVEERIRTAYVGARVVRRRVLSRSWFRRPVNHVIAVGYNPFTSSRSFSGLSRPFTMVASEYDVYLGGAGSGRTCTGIRARRGVVAVDPRFIPLGTHLYVQGYGYCVAADTGGAIKGRRIDLCVASNHEANRYGMHRVRVFIVR